MIRDTHIVYVLQIQYLSIHPFQYILYYSYTKEIHVIVGYPNETALSIRIGGPFPEVWSYTDEDEESKYFQITPSEVLQTIHNIDFDSVDVETDLSLEWRADDSYNPSVIEAYGLKSKQRLSFLVCNIVSFLFLKSKFQDKIFMIDYLLNLI